MSPFSLPSDAGNDVLSPLDGSLGHAATAAALRSAAVVAGCAGAASLLGSIVPVCVHDKRGWLFLRSAARTAASPPQLALLSAHERCQLP